MSEVKSPYAVKMTRKDEGKVEVTIVSTSLHKSNENLQVLVQKGFTLSDTLSRTKGGLSFGSNAQYILFVVGTDEQAKELSPSVYQELVGTASETVVEETSVEKVEVATESAVDEVAPKAKTTKRSRTSTTATES